MNAIGFDHTGLWPECSHDLSVHQKSLKMIESKHCLILFYPNLPLFIRFILLLSNIIYDLYFYDINLFAIYFYYKEILFFCDCIILNKIINIKLFTVHDNCCICNMQQNDKIYTNICGHNVHEECKNALYFASHRNYCARCGINYI